VSKYAVNTDVPVNRTQADIERTLRKYGADDVITGSSQRQRQALVQFTYRSLPLAIRVPLPDPAAPEFTKTPTGLDRSESAVQQAWEASCRQQWRVLLLILKAALEAVENDVLPPEKAFLPWIMLPTGQTIGDAAMPHVARMLSSGEVPLLPFGGR